MKARQVLAVIAVLVGAGIVMIAVNIAMALASPKPWYHWLALAGLAAAWAVLTRETARAWAALRKAAGEGRS